MPPRSVTRGRGLLETHLARKRGRMAEALIPAAAREGRIVDIGCGAYPLFLTQTSVREKHGLDRLTAGVDPDALRTQGIELHTFDLERDARLPFGDGFADIVTMLAVFEHLSPQRLAPLVREIYRVLKPGGIYILTTPAHWTGGILRALAWLRLVSCEEIDEHKDAYSHRQIASVLTAAGFGEDHLKLGSFELGMNLWATAVKTVKVTCPDSAGI